MIQLILDVKQLSLLQNVLLKSAEDTKEIEDLINREIGNAFDEGTSLTPLYLPIVIVDKDMKVSLVRRNKLSSSYGGFEEVTFDLLDSLSKPQETITLKASDFKWVLESYMSVSDVETVKDLIKW